MRPASTLRYVIAFGLILTLLLSPWVGAWQTHRRQACTLSAALERDQKRLADILAPAMAKALAATQRDLDAAKLLVDAAAGDARVVRVLIAERSDDAAHSLKRFIEFHQPQRQRGKLLALDRPILLNGAELGRLQLEMDSGQMEAALSRDFWRLVLTAALQLALWMAVLLFVLKRSGLTSIFPSRDQRSSKEPHAGMRAEESHQSAVRLRALVEHLPLGAIYVENGSTMLNRAAEKITGYSRSEITHIDQWFDKIFGAGKERLRRLYEDDKAAGFPVPRDIEIIRKDGVPCIVEVAGYSDAHSEVWLLYDITERKMAEAALRHTLLEQEVIFDNALVGIEVAKDRVIQRCNRRLEAMLGYGRGELAGQSTRIIFPSDESYEALGKIAYDDISAGRISVGEWEMRCKDGSLIWCSYHGSAVDPEDPSKGAIWAAQDITERKRTDAALKRALLEQQAIFDNASVGIILVKERLIHRCNRGLEQMLGYQAGELSGQSTRIFFSSDESHDVFDQRTYAAIAVGNSWIGEWEVLHKDGSKLWLSTHVSAVDPQDISQGTIWVGEDISRRKRIEAAQATAKDVLERALAEVRQTYRDVTMLSELSSYLQACQLEQDACTAIGGYGLRLFPDGIGAIYLMDDTHQIMVERASWGEPAPANRSFRAEACRGLRLAKAYRLDQPESSLCCDHLQDREGKRFPYVCLPLVAQGETFGLLFVEHRGVLKRDKLETRNQLATALAEQAGLALANLRLRERLRQLSIRDPLTGLYNRRYMDEMLLHELARANRNNSNLAVAIIDVDHFKLFNDRFGHDAGSNSKFNFTRGGTH